MRTRNFSKPLFSPLNGQRSIQLDLTLRQNQWFSLSRSSSFTSHILFFLVWRLFICIPSHLIVSSHLQYFLLDGLTNHFTHHLYAICFSFAVVTTFYLCFLAALDLQVPRADILMPPYALYDSMIILGRHTHAPSLFLVTPLFLICFVLLFSFSIKHFSHSLKGGHIPMFSFRYSTLRVLRHFTCVVPVS